MNKKEARKLIKEQWNQTRLPQTGYDISYDDISFKVYITLNQSIITNEYVLSVYIDQGMVHNLTQFDKTSKKFETVKNWLLKNM